MLPLDTSIELEGNTLRVCGELGPDEEEPFENTLRKLMEMGHSTLVIDLSGVDRMRSLYVRHIALAMARANKEGRSITVRAKRPVLNVLVLAGLDKLGKIEFVSE